MKGRGGEGGLQVGKIESFIGAHQQEPAAKRGVSDTPSAYVSHRAYLSILSTPAAVGDVEMGKTQPQRGCSSIPRAKRLPKVWMEVLCVRRWTTRPAPREEDGDMAAEGPASERGVEVEEESGFVIPIVGRFGDGLESRSSALRSRARSSSPSVSSILGRPSSWGRSQPLRPSLPIALTASRSSCRS